MTALVIIATCVGPAVGLLYLAVRSARADVEAMVRAEHEP